ncbi:MAG: hypothetical protein ACRYF5_06400 [Janthinobacterium lividum]
MDYFIGQTFHWLPASQFETVTNVSITGLRKRGHAMLSNGWVVDEDGIAEGTSCCPGGRIYPIADAVATQ